ncbi:hypothetical protein EJ05DRAFT_488668 [Pseudovirgaria hyperparasitica]|uniref:Structure-specific endonuclease subunit SLX4 n=1 Tax=Pseudovirgaria hyperparasitica TaxID=470096 RepID=A0A6A6VWR5_9PEZI|nr:uncharacterized protein EJ05DRAFT_488668 [Pseudovirgaria hyperparasitica]KAF2755128.1 hypothetical protein EJ05DRAFT_488668 [Pseudovirgaria hyperparasitica]
MKLADYNTSRRRSLGNSSDTLPSPSTFTSFRDAGIKSGSRAATVPDGAAGFGFHSVSGLVRERRLSLEARVAEDVTQKAESKAAKKPVKSRAPKVAKEPEKSAEKKARPAKKTVLAPKIEIPDSDGESVIELDTPPISAQAVPAVLRELRDTVVPGHAPPKKTPAPRKRKRKADDEATDKAEKAVKQSRIKKPKVVKPGVGPKKTAKGTGDAAAPTAKKKTTGKVSSHFGPKEAIEKSVTSKAGTPEPLKLDLEGAVQRRTEWTPVKNTTSNTEQDDGTHDGPIISNTQEKVQHQEAFQSMVGSFACAPQMPELANNTDPLAKSRRIELVATSRPEVAKSAAERVKKPRPSRKRPTTITDRATEHYRVVEQPPAPAPPSESPFFASAKTVPRTDDVPRKGKISKPRQKRAPCEPAAPRANGKRKRAASPKKKATVVVPMLLSPESALRKLDTQDFLFGTSSQLAQPESPSFIRALQMSFNDCTGVVDTGGSELSDSRLTSVRGSRTLWEAAWRDAAIGDKGVWQRGSSQIVSPEEAELGEETESGEADQLEASEQRPEDPVQSRGAVNSTPVTVMMPPKTGDTSDVLEETVATEAPRPETAAPAIPPPPKATFISLISSPILTPTPSPKLRPTDTLSAISPPLPPTWANEQSVIAITSSPPLTLSSPSSNDDSALPSPSRFLTQAPAKSPCRAARLALKSLTPNSRISFTQPAPFKASAVPTARPFHTTLSPQNKKKKKSVVVDALPTTPTKRPVGRPRRTDVSESPSPPKRPVGRPRKDAAAEPAATAPPVTSKPRKSRKTPPSATAAADDTSYVDDEIEDSDLAALPPSPPVRLSPPKARKTDKKNGKSTTRDRNVQIGPLNALQLELQLSQTPDCPTLHANANAAQVRTDALADAGDEDDVDDWPTHRALLFPQITAALRDEAALGGGGSADKTRLCWLERILLYDPVAPGQLAGWLCGRGVRTGWVDRRGRGTGGRGKGTGKGGKGNEKAKGMGKGDTGKEKDKKGKDKKKRADDNSDGSDDSAVEEGVEVEVDASKHGYPVAAWQVYEYLEAHGVCCVWDESLRRKV